MTRLISAFACLLIFHFASGQCGPYILAARDSSTCPFFTLTVSGASGADKIIWQKNGVPFDTVMAVAMPDTGGTVAGGNSQGGAANQLNYPSAVYLDSAANIYVADAQNNRIQKFLAGSTSTTNGTTVAGGNSAGATANQLNTPYGIYVDYKGAIYVADADNERIQRFPSGSTALTNGTTLAGGNGYGSASNQFFFPFGVYPDTAGNIYVADYNNNRIQKFPAGSTSASNGITVADQLSNPTDVYVDRAGNIYVADYSNNRIQKFPPNSTSGTSGVTVAGGTQGSGSYDLYHPQGLYVDSAGNIYVADQGNHRIQKFLAGSTNGITVAGGNGAGSASNQLNSPSGVYVDAAGNIYIADTQNERIQKWPRPGITTIDTSLLVTSPGIYSAIISTTPACSATSNTISERSSNLTLIMCQGSFYAFNGNNLYNPGTYYDTVASGSGCDSIITLHLQTNPTPGSTVSDTICQGSTYSFHGNTLAAPGTYFDTIIAGSIHGCDSVVRLQLAVLNSQINPIFTIQQSGTSHLWYAINPSAGIPGLSYLWSWGDGTNSTGDTPSHIYAVAGNYTICLTVTASDGCSATYCDSNTYLYKTDGQMIYIDVISKAPDGMPTINANNLDITFYQGAVHLSASLQSPTSLKLYDMSGRLVARQNNFLGLSWPMSDAIAEGVYIITLQNDTNTLSKKIVINH